MTLVGAAASPIATAEKNKSKEPSSVDMFAPSIAGHGGTRRLGFHRMRRQADSLSRAETAAENMLHEARVLSIPLLQELAASRGPEAACNAASACSTVT